MKKEKIIELLKVYNTQDVEKFASYLIKLEKEIDRKTNKPKNLWIQGKKEETFTPLFERVHAQGLVFDGEHVTLQSTGICYDYVAYKNKMLIAYPESKIDMNVVYEGEDFSASKENGTIIYSHKIGNPFNRKQENIVGAYCIIKNKRGEFLTTLNIDDINKHRKVAKTDYIWRSWFVEMALKTIIKKACKLHFADIYLKIEEQDNENYNLENPLDLDFKIKSKIDEIKNINELQDFYKTNKDIVENKASFNKYISIKKEALKNGNN